MPPTLNEIAFSDAKFVVVKRLPYEGGEVGDVCQVAVPNDIDEEINNGFIVQNLRSEMFSEVADVIDDELKRISEEFDFAIIEWKDFSRFFLLISSNSVDELSSLE